MSYPQQQEEQEEEQEQLKWLVEALSQPKNDQLITVTLQ